MATLKELQDSVDNTGKIKDNSYALAKTAHESLFKCVKGKGATSNCPSGQPLGSDKYPNFGYVFNTGDCKVCNSIKDCTTDCCSEESCKSRGNDYNSKLSQYNIDLNSWNTAKSNLTSSPLYAEDVKTKLEKAKTIRIVAIISVITVAVVLVIWFLKYKKVI